MNAAEAYRYHRYRFEHGKISHDVWWRGDGPPVLLLHEMGGLDRRTIKLAEEIREAGFRVVAPVMVGPARDEPSMAGLAANMVRICVSWEVVALGQRRTSPIVGWLLALARAEQLATGGRLVGVVGMCMSGGFALGTAIDPSVGVAVVSQPSLPIAWNVFGLLPGQKRDLGVSDADLGRLRRRRDAGELCIRALRYEDDGLSPGDRLERLKTELGDAVSLEQIPSRESGDHPVLTDAAAADGSDDARAALQRTIALLKERLT